MRNTIMAFVAALSLPGLAGCNSERDPANASMVRYQVDSTRERSWWLTRDGVLLHSAAQGRKVVALPDWLWATELLCPPDVAVGPDGEAVVTSNVLPTLWRIDPQSYEVTVHELQRDADTNKDLGFAAIVYAPEHGAYFAYSESPPSVWKLDRELRHATKVADADLSRVRTPRTASARGPCAELGHRLTQFVAVGG